MIAGQGQDRRSVRVIFPTDESVVESGRFDLLCVMAEPKAAKPRRPSLRVDGRREPWAPYEPPVLLSRLRLRPGRHDIAIGSIRLRVYVAGGSEMPDDVREWPVYRTHLGMTEGLEECGVCHKVRARRGRTIVGELMEPAACHECHSPGDFEGAHFHPLDPLASCHTCHALHGSSRPSLLRAPAKMLCAECHD